MTCIRLCYRGRWCWNLQWCQTSKGLTDLKKENLEGCFFTELDTTNFPSLPFPVNDSAGLIRLPKYQGGGKKKEVTFPAHLFSLIFWLETTPQTCKNPDTAESVKNFLFPIYLRQGTFAVPRLLQRCALLSCPSKRWTTDNSSCLFRRSSYSAPQKIRSWLMTI